MGFTKFGDIANNIDAGKCHYQYISKASISSPGVSTIWHDMSMSSGQPKYNAYPGTQQAATVMTGTANDGIYIGPTHTNSTKHIARWSADIDSTCVPVFVKLLDYLMFYPLIDGDDLTQQDLDNTQVLTRYTDGIGVRLMLVAATPIATAGTITINYTNSSGVSGRTTTIGVYNGPTVGNVVGCASTTTGIGAISPFVRLASGDIGIKSIESVTVGSSLGGFLNLVLVKQIAELPIMERSVSAEKNYGTEFTKLPQVETGAYLNTIAICNTGATWNMRSEILFVNS